MANALAYYYKELITVVKVTDNNKLSSFLRYGINYARKKCYTICLWLTKGPNATDWHCSGGLFSTAGTDMTP